MGPERGRPGSPTQAVRHTCSGNIGIAKILCYIKSIVNNVFGRKIGPGADPGGGVPSAPLKNPRKKQDWLDWTDNGFTLMLNMCY